MSLLKQRFLIFFSALVLTSIAFFGGVYTGYESRPGVDGVFSLMHTEAIASSTNPVDFSAFSKVWKIINEKYVTPGKVSDQEKVWGAIEGLVRSLGDPYTVFMRPQESKNFRTEINGEIEGVGMEVGLKEEILTVIAPLKGSPAEIAGIKAGDKILKINDIATTDMTVEEAIVLIRGPKGTTVSLTLLREGRDKPLKISVVRDVVAIPTLETEFRKDGIFVIRLYNFSAVSSKLFKNALDQFALSKSNKLIVDVRGNPGGFLGAALDMASSFLPKGKVIVREDFGGKREETVHRSDGRNLLSNKNLKMIVLVDGGSASASEILAGALQESGIARLVGTKTFGKGSVQELVNITSHPQTSLKITISRWLTPSGRSISEGGLTPDVEVKMTPEDREKSRDPQMDTAVEILLKQ